MTRKRRFWIQVALAVPVAVLSPALAAEPRGNVVSRAALPLDPKLLDRIETRISRQLRQAGIRIRQGADPDVVEGGYTAAYHGRNDPWNDILQISRLDNPLVTDECRAGALTRTLGNATDRERMIDHLEDQIEIWEQVRQGVRHLRLSEILLHLSECDDGCGPYMAGVLSCHIEGARSRPRAIVYFDAGRPQSAEERYFVFSRKDERKITDFARRALKEGSDVILLSRASHFNALDRHNISGNNALAWRRARVVDRLLVEGGFPRDRIRWKILSCEAPRLAAGDVAAAYGFLDDWQNKAYKEAMDQSVVLVAY